MRLQANQTAILTGASGGLGKYIARRLKDYNVNLALVAFPGKELPPLQEELQKANIGAFYMAADLRLKEERDRVAAEVKERFGKTDLLINNAGVEFTSPYHSLSEDEVQSVIDVNLVAPMQLSRLLIPEMLEAGSGHIVNMSSLAGKVNPAYQEAYAAKKAGLIAFTNSLRESYRGEGVSASVICPGFVEAGIYERLKTNSGYSAPALLGTSPPEKVADAVVKSIEKDLPQVIVNALPVKPLLATAEISPRLGAWMVRLIGAHKFFKKVYEAQR